jgi:glycosyltransferase involved in cell wall biosynthesis
MDIRERLIADRKCQAQITNCDVPRLRVALFSGNYNIIRDGANNALNRLVGHLLERGAQVRIYSPTVPNPGFEAPGEVVSVPSVAIPARSEYRLSLGLNRSTIKDIEAFNPTLIHVSAPDPQGYQAQKFAKARGIPLVTSLHTRFETYFQYYGLRRFRPMVERYLQYFYARSDLVLVPNQQIEEELAGWNMGNRLAIWSRGVDRDRFHPRFRDLEWRREQGWADNEVVPLFFGRLVREKGIAEFAEVIARVRETGINARPMIVGDGPARMEFARLLPVGHKFLGHLSGPELSRAVASADILINPSTTEAFGNVNLEAMAAGLALVSADVASARALIADNDNGLLVPPHDLDAYAGAYSDLATSLDRRRTLGMAASATAMAFNWTNVSSDVVAHYLELI